MDLVSAQFYRVSISRVGGEVHLDSYFSALLARAERTHIQKT
jgi:hypothetical protein